MKYLLFILFIIFSITKQYEYLVQELFVKTPIPQSDLNQINARSIKCQQKYYSEFIDQDIILVELKQIKQIYFTNLIPHWKISIRMDLLLLSTLDSNDYLDTIIYQNSQQSFAQGYRKVYGSGNKFCVGHDELLQFAYQTETQYDIKQEFKGHFDEAYDNEGAGFKNYYFYVDTCHPSCLTCSSSTDKSCLTCEDQTKYNSSNQSCSNCDDPKVYHFGKCTDNCPKGYYNDNGICQINYNYNFTLDESNCANETQIKCDKCKDNHYLVDGQCIFNDFQYYKPIIQTQNSQLIFKGLYSKNFGELEIINLDLQVKYFYGQNASVTSCKDYRLLGGAYLSSVKSEIKKTFTNLQPHSQIEISFLLFQIDFWELKKLQINIDGKEVPESEFKTIQLLNDYLCGSKDQKDNVVQVILKYPHNLSNLTIKISTNLNLDSLMHAFGIRELYISTTNCPSKCQECNSDGCTKCDLGTLLYQFACQKIDKCPQKTFQFNNENKCVDCIKNCQECKEDKKCEKCEDQYFLDPNGQCVQECPPHYYGSERLCKNCDLKCYKCTGNLETDCTACENTYLQKSKNICVNKCDSNQFQDDQNHICVNCDSNCKTCNGSKNTNCLSCNIGKYFQQSSSECVKDCNSNQFIDSNQNSCIDCNPNCKTCSGRLENECISCSNTTYLQQSSGTCVPACEFNQFEDKSQRKCIDCNQNCKTCSGPNENQCISCKKGTFLDKQQNICVSQCKDGYYNNEQSNECIQCHIKCLYCNGGTEYKCLPCKLSYYYLKSNNSCVTKCNSNQYQSLQKYFNNQVQNDTKNPEVNLTPACIDCNVAYGKGCQSCTDQGCSKCEPNQFLDGKNCVDKCPDTRLIYDENNKCLDSCSLFLQGNVCQKSCTIGYFPQQSIPKSNNSIQQNSQQNIQLYSLNSINSTDKTQYCHQCSEKCKECEQNADNCTLCKDKNSLDCMSDNKKEDYLKKKLCDSLKEYDDAKCKKLVLQTEDLYQLENIIGFSSIITMLIFALTSHSFAGFVGIYYLQISQQLGNYCLLNIDYLYFVKELTLKYSLANNIFNLIPVSLLFQKNDDVKSIYSSQLYPNMVEIQPITNNFIHNYFFQGCILGLLYLISICLFIFFRRSKIQQYFRFNILIKVWMICSNMLLLNLTQASIFSSEALHQHFQIIWYLVISNLYIAQQLINIYKVVQFRVNDSQNNQLSGDYWQIFQSQNLQFSKRLFWILFEIRKAIIAFTLTFTKDSLISIWVNISLNGILMIYIILMRPINTNMKNGIVLLLELIYTSLLVLFTLSNSISMSTLFMYILLAYQGICNFISITLCLNTLIKKVKQYKSKQSNDETGINSNKNDLFEQFEMSPVRTYKPTANYRTEKNFSVYK